MASFTWLHLSDWHQRGASFDVSTVLNALTKDLVDRRTRISSELDRIDLVVFSGDIAYSGKEAEFDAAAQGFFPRVFEAAGLGIDAWDKLVIVPGNHDLDQDELPKALEKLAGDQPSKQEISQALFDPSTRESLLAPFAAYSQFVKGLWEGRIGQEVEPAYGHVRRFGTEDGRRIAIAALNSALLCGRHQHDRADRNGVLKPKHEDYGYLAVGEPQVEEALKDCEDADICIVVLHHPIGWLCESDRLMLEDYLKDRCHFLIHGHEHMPRTNVVRGTMGDMVTIPAGASYNYRSHEPRYIEAYNLVHLNFDEGIGTVHMRRLKSGQRFDRDTDAAQEGKYSFMLPMNVTPERHAASRAIMRKLTKDLGSGHYDLIDVHYWHSIESVAGREWSRWQAVRTARIGSIKSKPGDPFRITLNVSQKVADILKDEGASTKPLRFTYFKHNGKEVKPTSETDTSIVFELHEADSGSFIEFEHVSYDFIHQPCVFTLSSFCKELRFAFNEDANFEYVYQSLGGAQDLKPEKFGAVGHMKATMGEWVHPGQGYLIQCHRRETSSDALVRIIDASATEISERA
jgi:predicted phosphodiesterase